MRFCTTCGRTYDDDSLDTCAYDGTPLFDMAGGGGGFAEGVLPEDNVDAGGLFGGAPKPAAPEPVVAHVPKPVVEPVVAHVPDPEPVVERVPEPIIARAPEPVIERAPEPSSRVTGSLAASDLFGESEGEEVEPAKPAEIARPTPQERAEAVAASLDLPDADDAASIRIAANIKNAIEEIEQDDPDDSMESNAPISARISSSYDQLPDSIHEARANAPREAEPPPPARSPLIPVLLVIIALALGGAAWYFLAGPGAQQPTPEPSKPIEQPTPAEAPKPAEEPKEEPKVEEPKPKVEEPKVEEPKPKDEPKPKEEPKVEEPKPKVEKPKPKVEKPKVEEPKPKDEPKPKEEPKEELDNELEKMMNQ